MGKESFIRIFPNPELKQPFTLILESEPIDLAELLFKQSSKTKQIL